MPEHTSPVYEILADLDALISLTEANTEVGEQPQCYASDADYPEFETGGYGLGVRLLDPNPIHFGGRVVFSGPVPQLDSFDLMPSNVSSPLISERFQALLRTLGPTDSEIIRTRIVNDEYLDPPAYARYYELDEHVQGIAHADGYVLLHFLSMLDLTEMRLEGVSDERLARLALPPMFMDEAEAGVFVTAQTRAAMERAGLRGIRYLVPRRFQTPVN